MSELAQLRLLARANRLANHRLHAACLQLSDAEFTAPRTSFFPSLWATLNHILIVDWYYIAALHREADMRKAFASETPFDRMPRARRGSDRLRSAADRLVRRRRRRGTGRRSRDAAFGLRPARGSAVRADASLHAPDPSPWAGARDAVRHRRGAAPARRVPDAEREPLPRRRPRRAWVDRDGPLRAAEFGRCANNTLMSRKPALPVHPDHGRHRRDGLRPAAARAASAGGRVHEQPRRADLLVWRDDRCVRADAVRLRSHPRRAVGPLRPAPGAAAVDRRAGIDVPAIGAGAVGAGAGRAAHHGRCAGCELCGRQRLRGRHHGARESRQELRHDRRGVRHRLCHRTDGRRPAGRHRHTAAVLRGGRAVGAQPAVRVAASCRSHCRTARTPSDLRSSSGGSIRSVHSMA